MPTSPSKIPVFSIALLVMITVTVIFQLFYATIYEKQNLLLILSDILLTALLELVITITVYGTVRFFDFIFKKGKSKWYRYVTELMVIIGCTIGLLYLNIYLWMGVGRYHRIMAEESILVRQYFGINLVGAAFCYLLVTGLFMYKTFHAKSYKAELLQKEFADVRLQALQNQLSPHFLFNSLSVLTTLVYENVETAEKFVSQLSVVYRYILEQKNAALVSLEQELRFLKAYFFLLEIRFENKLHLTTSVAADTENYLIAPLTLQILVENAVKHNKMSNTEPLRIFIFNEEDRLIITNNLNRRETREKSLGIGLKNIISRYQLIVEKEIKVSCTPSLFMVTIPLIKK